MGIKRRYMLFEKVNDDGTIFIGNVTLEDEDIHIYKRINKK